MRLFESSEAARPGDTMRCCLGRPRLFARALHQDFSTFWSRFAILGFDGAFVTFPCGLAARTRQPSCARHPVSSRLMKGRATPRAMLAVYSCAGPASQFGYWSGPGQSVAPSDGLGSTPAPEAGGEAARIVLVCLSQRPDYSRWPPTTRRSKSRCP